MLRNPLKIHETARYLFELDRSRVEDTLDLETPDGQGLSEGATEGVTNSMIVDDSLKFS